MTRAELTEKILGIKRDKGWSWKHICDEIGGMSPVLITGAMLGQMKLTKPQAAKAAELFGLSKSEQALLNEVPYRGSQMPPTDPLVYRFYELVMVNGPAWKALIEEEFGDGIMSAIDFDMQIERLPDPKGDRVKLTMSENSCRTNITAPPATRKRTATRKNRSVALAFASPSGGRMLVGRACDQLASARPSISSTLLKPVSAMVTFNSLRMISMARATPSCPPAPSP